MRICANRAFRYSFLRRKVASGHGSIFCNHSAVAMRLRARLASVKLTSYPWRSTTSWTTNSEYSFWSEFFLHRVAKKTTSLSR